MHCGVAEYTRMLITFLRSVAPSIKVYVFSTNESLGTEYIEGESNVRVIPCFRRFESDYTSLLNALESIGSLDLIHIQHEYGIFGYSLSLLKALQEAKELGLIKKIVITMHTVQHPLSGDFKAINFQRSLAKFVDLVIVHSRLQEFELQVQGVNIGKIVRIPHGTLLNPYLGMPKDKLLASIGVKGRLGRPLLVLPGFIRKDKGVDVLINALDILNKKPILVVAGEPRDEDVLELIKDRKYVVLLSKYLSSDEILRVTASADIIVMPYRDRPGTYSVSGILHLSMGALKPIVGTRVPRLVELYENANKLTVTPEDSKELAKVINWVLNHYDYAVVYASSLYSYAVRVQWARMARRHLRIYRRISKVK